MKPFSLTKTLFLSLLATFIFNGTALAFTEFDGKKTTIEEQVGDGKWTILEVWASDCHACRIHMPDMVEFSNEKVAKDSADKSTVDPDKLSNVRLLGVALDGQKGKQAAQGMIDEYKIPFKTILSNPIELNAWMELNAEESLQGTPTFMIFDPKGKLVALQPGVFPVSSLEKFIRSKTSG